jgi:hypothetical protein
MSLEYKILGQELVSYTDVPGEPESSYYVTYEQTASPLFVAISFADYTASATSEDGISWQKHKIIPYGFWSELAYGNGKFVALREGMGIYSSDGITWTQTSISVPEGVSDWTSIVFGGGKFVATAAYTDYMIYSSDGISWSEVEWNGTPAVNIMTLGYGANRFVAFANSLTSNVAYSDDGIVWTQGNNPIEPVEWNDVAHGNGLFVAVSAANYSAYSGDGINWTSSLFPSGGQSPDSVAFGNNIFVAAKIASDNSKIRVVSSTNGIDWTGSLIQSPQTMNAFVSVSYGNGKFVMLARSGADPAEALSFVSTDGINWLISEALFPENSQRSSWHSMVYGETLQLTETLNIIGGQGTTQTEEFLPITVYTVPTGKQTTVTSIFVANHDDTDSTYDLAVVPAGEDLSLKHHIRWDMAVAAKDFENISTKITMSAGDKLVIFPSTADTVSITAFGVEK